MHTTAPLQKEAPKRTAVTTGKATTNPLQRKAVGEDEDALQMKQSPLQLQDGLEEEDEPLQMKAAPVQLEDGLDDEEEEPLQMKKNPLQRVEMDDKDLLQKKENPLQRKPYTSNPLQRKETEAATLQPKKENNTGLPDNLKAGVESLSGYSMDDVKVHYNSDKPAQLQALAYAQGTYIHVAPGQEQHLPHEAWHVVQQKQGRVQPTLQMKEGVEVNDDKRLESEADVMGTRALSSVSVSAGAMLANSLPIPQLQLIPKKTSANPPVQRTVFEVVKKTIFHAPGSEDIAIDVAKWIEDKNPGITDDEVTKDKIRETAEDEGYPSKNAERLANNNPYELKDIPVETKEIGIGHYETFGFARYPSDPATVSKHQLHFENKFSNGKWNMIYNARNVAISKFRAPDVAKHQESLSAGGKPFDPANFKTIKRQNVVSESGTAWYDKNKPPLDKPLSDEHLKSFLEETENGKSSAAMARGTQKKIVSGNIKKYKATGFNIYLHLESL